MNETLKHVDVPIPIFLALNGGHELLTFVHCGTGSLDTVIVPLIRLVDALDDLVEHL